MKLALLLVVFLSACAAAAPVKKERPWYTEKPVYYDYAKFDLKKVPPPPAPGSPEDEAELKVLEQIQNTRTHAQCDAASEEVTPDFENFFGHLSPFVRPTPELVDEIFWYLRSDTARTISRIKKHFNRERPFVRDGKRFQPCVKEEFGKSYPSGHAAIARIYARVLGLLDPAGRAAYEAHAKQSGWNRVVGGVHHPSDVILGARLADQIFEEMRKTRKFQEDVKRLRTQLAQP